MSLKALQAHVLRAPRIIPSEVEDLAEELYQVARVASAMGYSLDELAHIALEGRDDS